MYIYSSMYLFSVFWRDAMIAEPMSSQAWEGASVISPEIE